MEKAILYITGGQKMDKTDKIAIAAGNWKMNMLPSEVSTFFNEYMSKANTLEKTIFCVPYIDIPAAISAVKKQLRVRHIYENELIEYDRDKKLAILRVSCEAGTYVRTMCEKIAEALDTVGYMKELQRTMVGNFKIEDSVTIEELKENFDKKDFLNQKIISLESFFSKKDKVILGNKQLSLLLNGVLIGANYSDDIFRIYNENGIFIGIAVATNGKLKRKIIVEQ